MKGQNIILMFLLATLLLMLNCCKENAKDYREKWVGEYIGEYTTFFPTPEQYYRDTTRDAVVNVLIWEDSILLIKYNNLQWYPKINTDGYFYHFDEHSHHYCEGNMRGDSLIMSGGSGLSDHHSKYSYKGKKYKK